MYLFAANLHVIIHNLSVWKKKKKQFGLKLCLDRRCLISGWLIFLSRFSGELCCLRCCLAELLLCVVGDEIRVQECDVSSGQIEESERCVGLIRAGDRPLHTLLLLSALDELKSFPAFLFLKQDSARDSNLLLFWSQAGGRKGLWRVQVQESLDEKHTKTFLHILKNKGSVLASMVLWRKPFQKCYSEKKFFRLLEHSSH